MLHKKIVLFSVFLLILFALQFPRFSSSEERDISKKIFPGHYFTYIIYNNLGENYPILFSTFTLSSDIDGGNEIRDRKTFLYNGTYIMESGEASNELEFELESTDTEKKKRFNFKLKENTFYYLAIGLDNQGTPTAKKMNQNEGIALIKRLKRAKLQ